MIENLRVPYASVYVSFNTKYLGNLYWKPHVFIYLCKKIWTNFRGLYEEQKVPGLTLFFLFYKTANPFRAMGRNKPCILDTQHDIFMHVHTFYVNVMTLCQQVQNRVEPKKGLSVKLLTYSCASKILTIISSNSEAVTILAGPHSRSIQINPAVKEQS